MRADSVTAGLQTLARLPGVRAAVLTSEEDGLPAASVASVGVDVEALAAFAMSLFHRTRLANDAAGYGATSFLVLDAEGGRILVGQGAAGAIVVLAQRDAGVGALRVGLRRALESLA